MESVTTGESVEVANRLFPKMIGGFDLLQKDFFLVAGEDLVMLTAVVNRCSNSKREFKRELNLIKIELNKLKTGRDSVILSGFCVSNSLSLSMSKLDSSEVIEAKIFSNY